VASLFPPPKDLSRTFPLESRWAQTSRYNKIPSNGQWHCGPSRKARKATQAVGRRKVPTFEVPTLEGSRAGAQGPEAKHRFPALANCNRRPCHQDASIYPMSVHPEHAAVLLWRIHLIAAR
jgi:hypothetical protein